MPVTMKTGAVNVKNLDTNLYENMDINISEDFAPINSPAFTGTPTAPTQAASDDSTKIATTAFVHDLVDPKAGGYGTCSTASGTTAKVVAMDNYELVKGGQVVIKFTYAVPANATLNINSQGAKAIYFKESIMGSSTAIDGSTIRAGDICTFVYDGTHYVLTNIDRWGLPATPSRSGLMSADDKSKLNNLDSSDIMDDSDVGGATAKESLNILKGSLNTLENSLNITSTRILTSSNIAVSGDTDWHFSHNSFTFGTDAKYILMKCGQHGALQNSIVIPYSVLSHTTSAYKFSVNTYWNSENLGVLELDRNGVLTASAKTKGLAFDFEVHEVY